MCGGKLVLEHGMVAHPGKYTSVILLNGDVRGPFMPTFVERKLTWVDTFLFLLRDGAHLAGTSIDCLLPTRGDNSHTTSLPLYLKTSAVAFDLLGAKLVHSKFQCYDEAQSGVSDEDISFTQTALNAGHGIAALQSNWNKFTVYLKDLFGDEVSRRCSAVASGVGVPSSSLGLFSGVGHPYEVIFIETHQIVDDFQLERLTQLHDQY